MKPFLLSLAAIALISVAAGMTLNALDRSSSNVYSTPDVRLN